MRASTFGLSLILVLSWGASPAIAQSNAQTLFEQGVKLHDSGQYAAAAEAFRKAREGGYPARMALNVRLARAQARAGATDAALQTLRTMVENGYAQFDALNEENDFLSLRMDNRWKEVVAAARVNQQPCTRDVAYRQFDYWLGEWDVEVQDNRVARSSVQLILNECTIFENYWRLDGTYAGKSFTVWDRADKRWEQRYVDTTGVSADWFGVLDDGRMVFHQRPAEGTKGPTQRMIYTKEGPDRVRQTIETSNDDGKTWSTQFNGLYIRKK